MGAAALLTTLASASFEAFEGEIANVGGAGCDVFGTVLVPESVLTTSGCGFGVTVIFGSGPDESSST